MIFLCIFLIYVACVCQCNSQNNIPDLIASDPSNSVNSIEESDGIYISNVPRGRYRGGFTKAIRSMGKSKSDDAADNSLENSQGITNLGLYDMLVDKVARALSAIVSIGIGTSIFIVIFPVTLVFGIYLALICLDLGIVVLAWLRLFLFILIPIFLLKSILHTIFL